MTPFVYIQRTGFLYGPDKLKWGTCYSGHGSARDNPAMDHAVGVGPLPRGLYEIGDPHTPVGHLGPLAMPLIPDEANEMYGRSAFFIHGDNRHLNHTASNGCIIADHALRQRIADAFEGELLVVADESDVAKAQEDNP